MPENSSPIEAYSRAVALEKAAWEAVRDHLPGSASYSQELWQRWRTAVCDADEAAGVVKKSAAVLSSAGAGSRFNSVRLPPILGGRKPQGPQA